MLKVAPIDSPSNFESFKQFVKIFRPRKKVEKISILSAYEVPLHLVDVLTGSITVQMHKIRESFYSDTLLECPMKTARDS
jgi:hypothetical protein